MVILKPVHFMYRLFLLYLGMDNLLRLYKQLNCKDEPDQHLIHRDMVTELINKTNIEIDYCFCACGGNKRMAMKILKANGKL